MIGAPSVMRAVCDAGRHGRSRELRSIDAAGEEGRLWALIRNLDGAVLLVKPTYKEGWDIPGGLVEADESPREAAQRECLEELGRNVEIGALLCVHYAPGARTPGYGICFVFDGGTSSTSPDDHVLPADELSDLAFIRPAELNAYLPSVMVVRLLAAIEATRMQAIVYLER